jgi:hypothetical protein
LLGSLRLWALASGELRERKALTDAIVANLKTISGDSNDLDELEKQTGNIATGFSRLSEELPPC